MLNNLRTLLSLQITYVKIDKYYAADLFDNEPHELLYKNIPVSVIEDVRHENSYNCFSASF